jgi:hypothetical protein
MHVCRRERIHGNSGVRSVGIVLHGWRLLLNKIRRKEWEY